MRLLLIGAPGAGKGTQAERLAERFSITHISSGDLLRQHVTEQTSIGQTIKAYLDAGDLVPDSVVLDMLRKPVVTAAESGGYVLDGFPRTVEQAKAAFEVASALGVAVQAAVHLDVPDDELIRRLLARGRGSADCGSTGKRPSRYWSTTPAGNGCSPSTAPGPPTRSTRTSWTACGNSPPSPSDETAGTARTAPELGKGIPRRL